MIPRLLVISAILTFCSALPAADPAPQEPPKKDPFQRDVEEYEFFFGKPANIPEFWNAIQYEISVGRPGVAAMFLDQMLAFAAKLEEKKRAEEWLKLEKKEGMASILTLNAIKY